MYRSILVPLDGSKFGEHALPLAMKIARQAQASLQLVHVHVPLAPLSVANAMVYDDRLDVALQQDERTYLENAVQRVAEHARVPVTSTLLEGRIGDALEAHASRAGVDLIVMTTHGRGSLARAWLGSVADELVRRTTLPVILVRPHEAKLDLAQELSLRHVLIPLDGSPMAEQIIEPVVALGSLFETDYTLLRAISPMIMGRVRVEDEPTDKFSKDLLDRLETMFEQDRATAAEYLGRLAAQLRTRSLRVQTRVLVHDQPALAILEEVAARRIDLVAIETHGRSGLPRLFLGSVADKILRGTSVPVLVHRPRN
jgi:nucleotide-binding universal stress UspA family protein